MLIIKRYNCIIYNKNGKQSNVKLWREFFTIKSENDSLLKQNNIVGMGIQNSHRSWPFGCHLIDFKNVSHPVKYNTPLIKCIYEVPIFNDFIICRWIYFMNVRMYNWYFNSLIQFLKIFYW